MAERAIGHNDDVILFAPGKHRAFNRPLFEMVENLIAYDPARSGNAQSLFKIRHIKIADSPGKNFSFPAQVLEGCDCFFKRVRTPPVQKVAVQMVSSEASERSFASQQRSMCGGSLEKDLRHKKTSSRLPAIASPTIFSAAPSP
jgi:hypothetical protein